MKNRIYFKIFLFLLISVSMNAQEKHAIPEPARVGEDGLIKSELIFSLSGKPTPECHASTIVETNYGLIAAWFGGTEERAEDVGIWVSMNLNGRWSKPVEVANGFVNDTLRYPTWNPVLFQPENGPLMLFYKIGPTPRDWWGMLTTSENEGRTWSYPEKLGEDEKIGHLIGPVKNKPIQLDDGTIICPSSTESITGDETYWKVHFEISSDLGKTWKVVGPINDGVQFDAIQPSILEYPGKLQILCRTRQKVIAQSWSEDEGKNWSELSATGLPNPNAGTDAVTLKNGLQLLVYNHTTREGSFPKGRNMLNVAVSEDGLNWNPVLTLEKHEGEYSYPAVIQTTDGKVHVTYTFNRKSIKHVVINPEMLNR